MRDKKHNKTLRLVPIFMGLLLALILIAAIGFLYTRYVRVNGEYMRTDLPSMDLSNKGITDISPLARCRDLRSLDLRGNPVTGEDVLELEKALPDCEILYDITLNGQTYESTVSSLELEDLPADWETIFSLRHLRSLTVARCTNPSAMESLQEGMPDCAMSWALGLGGSWYDSGVTSLDISGTAPYYEELLSQLMWFRSLESVRLRSAVLTLEQQRSLLQAYPDVSFAWPVAVGDVTLQDTAEALIFAQTNLADPAPLEDAMDLLPALHAVDFTGSRVSAEDRIRFQQDHPEMEVTWSIPLLGAIYPSDVEMLDFSNIAFSDTEALEEAIPYLPALKQIDMCNTGLSNETLDELNRRLENVKIVWTVSFSSYTLRTDATYFCASAIGIDHPYITDRNAEVFRYLTDMVALDMGHMSIHDLSFVEYMPHLTYLIIAECPILDISPLAACKELKYLEMFHTDISDISPLLECPEMESLNLCYTAISQKNAYETLMNIPKLGRLWYCHCPLNAKQREELQAAHPDCILFLIEGGEPSGGSWRYDQRYYDMRDALHMPYMPGGTNGLDEDGAQIIVDDLGHEFHLEDFDNGPYWWTEERYSDMHPYIIGVTA